MDRTNCVIDTSVFLTCFDCGTELGIYDHNLETSRVQVWCCSTCKRKIREEAYAEGVAAIRKALINLASAGEVLHYGDE
jgi:ribosomal protein L37AE/L43A